MRSYYLLLVGMMWTEGQKPSTNEGEMGGEDCPYDGSPYCAFQNVETRMVGPD